MATFIWYELLTKDAEAAASFYSGVVGWVAEDSGQTAVRYTLLKSGSAPVAGVMALTPNMLAHEVSPMWLGYVHVDDVDAAVAAVQERGGRLRQAPPDIPEVGRFAVVADPQGAAFGLFAPIGAADEPTPAPMSPGSVGWHELRTSDWHSAFEFYADHFGWAKSQAMDMGPMGTYQLVSEGGRDIGAMFNDASLGGPAWLFYFVVGDIDDAAQRVRAGGGEVLNEPMEVPGGAWVIQCRDPQGAMFALVGSHG
jgi:hypothetical protein